MRDGVLLELLMLERHTVANDAGSWPTPCARDYCPAHKREYIEAKRAQGHGMSKLNDAVAHQTMFPTPLSSNTKAHHMRSGGRPARSYWPTPTVNDSKNSTLPPSQVAHDNIPGALLRDGEKTGGQLNPTWVEWLMGWPLGWTDLKPLETDKCRNAQ
jgi:hypothetical protein